MKSLVQHNSTANSTSSPRSAPKVSGYRYVRRGLGRTYLMVSATVASLLRRAAERAHFLSSVYYFFFSSAFRREQRAFLAGAARFRLDQRQPSAGSALLRRNIHRIEKGLLMRPRRPLFAVEYIADTVDCYCRLAACRTGAEHGSDGEGEFQWAHDALAEYFSSVASHPVVNSARDRFMAASRNCGCAEASGGMVPYRRAIDDLPSVTIDDLLELARRRRSVRWFLNRPVPRDLIERAIEVAAQSPSACNRQPFVFHVLDDPQLVRQASVIPMGTGGFAHNIPVFVVIVGQQRNYIDERDRHLIYIDGSLAAMSFVYALESQGLSSCCLNWPDIESRERQMAKVLRLEKDERPVMCIALGYPDPEGLVAYSQKKQVSQLCQYNLG